MQKVVRSPCGVCGKPVSHRAYGFYGQTRTVNAYGHPKIFPRYGLVRSARTVSMVSWFGQYGHAVTSSRPDGTSLMLAGHWTGSTSPSKLHKSPVLYDNYKGFFLRDPAGPG